MRRPRVMYCCSFAPLGKSPRACPRHLRRRFRGRAQGSNLPRCLPLSCNRGRGGSGDRCSRACGWCFLNRSLGASAFAMPHAREYRRSQPCSKRNSAQIGATGHAMDTGHVPCVITPPQAISGTVHWACILCPMACPMSHGHVASPTFYILGVSCVPWHVPRPICGGKTLGHLTTATGLLATIGALPQLPGLLPSGNCYEQTPARNAKP